MFYAGYGFVTTFTKLLLSYMPELQKAFVKLTYLLLMLGSIGGIISNTFGCYLTDILGRRMLIIPTAILLITIYPLYLALTTLSILIMALSLALMYFVFTPERHNANRLLLGNIPNGGQVEWHRLQLEP